MDSCKNARSWSTENQSSEIWKRIEEEYKDLIEELADDKYFGLPDKPNLLDVS